MLDRIRNIFNLSKPKSSNIELAKAYQDVLATESGKKVLTDLLKFSKIYDSTFVPSDSHTTAFYEGMRRVGLRIASLINVDVNDKQNHGEINDGFESNDL
jgi:hypothetical protein